MEKHDAKRHEVLHHLEEEGSVSREAIRRVSEKTGVPEADVYGVARFYDLLVRPGARVCQGLSCLLAKGDLLGSLNNRHAVSCLGQCDRAPVSLDETLNLAECGPRGAISPDNPKLPINLAGADSTNYEALALARKNGADWVIESLKSAGLQGRGGAGFPAHFKWNAVRNESATPRYVICNADEAEPGTFKDREVMLRRPHLILEGLAIAAITIDSSEIYIYTRGEFQAAASSIEAALLEAQTSLADFNFHLIRGHGAYICGEETALIESIEGKRGMPRLKPPYPTQVGLFGKPTLMNNVETLACVPGILKHGGQWFKDWKKTKTKTKLYCISGHIANPGVYELPLGISLDELVAAAGGYEGTPHAFSPGGASSGFLPISERGRALSFRSLPEVGSMLGSAGVVVLNDTVDMAWAVRWQTIFFEDETCGQCAPCRIGVRMVRQAIDRYIETGDPESLAHLEGVAWEMDEGSICGLGMTAALPLISAIKHFPIEFGPRQAKIEGVS
ncbi:MAG TPA: NADH-quinone oxidoreductase subunit F [Myxococcales bacterium]|nr:NADH-quinone oxidoreductase subunit F [Myxococcales bacterium]